MTRMRQFAICRGHFAICNFFTIALAASVILAPAASATAQAPNVRYGEIVPRDVREMYDRGMQYLAKTQSADGGWTTGDTGPGATGLCLMVFLASGEDPNF